MRMGWDETQREQILAKMREVQRAVHANDREDDIIERALRHYYETTGKMLGSKKRQRFVQLGGKS